VPVDCCLPDLFWDIGLGIINEGGDVILRRPEPAPLVVNIPRLSVPDHDIGRLEVAEEKILLSCIQQVTGQNLKIPLKPGLIERCSYKLEEHVLVIVHIPDYALPVEAAVWITQRQVKPSDPFSLYAYQVTCDCKEEVFRLPVETFLIGTAGEPGKKVGITQVFKKIDLILGIIYINLRHR